MNQNELLHYGVLGMKWGVRRTPAQLARARGQTVSKNTSDNKSKTSTAKKSSSSTSGRKRLSDMTDDELRKEVSRLQLEQQYRNLNPEKVSLGKRFVNKVVKDVVIPAATTTARNTLQTFMKRELDKALKFDTGNNYDRNKDK